VAHQSEIVAFEPDIRAFKALKTGPGLHYLNVALHDHRGTESLNLTRKQDCSSLLRPNRELLDRFPDSGRFDIVGTQQIRVDTLDSQLTEVGMVDADLIKLDVQGSELAVLRGAQRTLADHVVGIETEVCFIPLYERQPLFSDVDAHLRANGFEPFELAIEYWKEGLAPTVGSSRGRLAFANALYLKSCEATLEMIGRMEAGRRQSKLLRALEVAHVYGHDDHGLRLVEEGRALLESPTFEAASRRLRRRVSLQRRIPDFPGRRAASSLIYQVYRVLRPRFWADYPTRYNRS